MEKKSKIPHPLVLVFYIMLFVTALTWIVPPSISVEDENGKKSIVYNAAFDPEDETKIIENVGPDAKGIWDIILAPVRGFAQSADVSIAILVSGAFLNILAFVGALDAGIGRLLSVFKGNVLIAILMFVFALMGAVYGSWEELPAYAIVIIPLFVIAGYDVLTGILVVLIGATAGNMSSFVNPYSTGAAMAAIGNGDLVLGDGIALRSLMFLVFYAVSTFLVIRYAEKVKKDKNASYIAGYSDINTLVDANKTEMPVLTPARKWSLAVFGIMIIATVFGYMPWGSLIEGVPLDKYVNAPNEFLKTVPILGDLLGASNFNDFGNWYFEEFSWVFLFGSIVVALINKMDEKTFAREFIEGCKQLLSLCLVLSVAKGVSIIMGSKTSGMSLTFVYWIQNLLAGVPVWAFVIAATLIYVAIGFFLQSTSGVAGITMPIFGLVAMTLFASSGIGGVGGQILLVSAFTMGLNFTSAIYPTATVMGILSLSNVPYSAYLKITLEIIIPMLVLGILVLSLAPYIGLV